VEETAAWVIYFSGNNYQHRVKEMKSYRYVGPDNLKKLVGVQASGKKVVSEGDLFDWVRESGKVRTCGTYTVVATYTIGLDGFLYIADRHSEHVVCAAGKDVLSAGEIGIHFDQGCVEISDISNQSTGYCPGSESWPAVKRALDAIYIEYPSSFTWKFKNQSEDRVK